MTARLRVKEVAEAKGFSMTKLTHRSELAYNTVRQIYRDPYRHISYVVLLKIAKALDVSMYDLFEEEPD